MVALNNQPCQARPTIVDIKSGLTLSYPFTVTVKGCITLLMIHILEFVFQIK